MQDPEHAIGDGGRFVAEGPPAEIAASLSTPGDGAFNASGSLFYLSALGSRKVGVLDGSGTVDFQDILVVDNIPKGKK